MSSNLLRGDKDDGHNYIRIVDRLPKYGNGNALYILRKDSINNFYKWNTLEKDYTKLVLVNEIEKLNLTNLSVYQDEAEASTSNLKKGDLYQTSTGELRIKL